VLERAAVEIFNSARKASSVGAVRAASRAEAIAAPARPSFRCAELAASPPEFP